MVKYAESWWQPKFADLGVQVVNDHLVVYLTAAGGPGEHFLKTRLCLALPS